MSYGIKQTGSKYSNSFKVYIHKDGNIISPFHDIPLREGSFINCVNEIPRFEHAKFEISKEESFNPIAQDTKKGKLRFVNNIFPVFGYPFNYGAIPQTWEDPNVEDSECKALGDNDPVDVIDIGSKVKKVGEVYQAKVLGALALLDDGEADWKIIAIDSKDDMAKNINSIDDVKKYMPGLIDTVFKWFRDYKVPTGSPQNQFAFEGRFLDSETAKKVIEKAHESWKKLVKDGHKDVKIDNCTVKDSAGFKNEHLQVKGEKEPDSERPDDVFVFSYVSI